MLTLLYFYISTFRSMCAVPNMAVFCGSLTLCFSGGIIIIIIIIIALLNTAWQNSIISTMVGPPMLRVQAMYIYVCGLPPYKLGPTQSQLCIFMSVVCLLTNLDPPSPSNIYLCLWPASLQTQTHPVPAMYIYICGLPPYQLGPTQSQQCIFMSVVCLLTNSDPPSPSYVFLCLWSASLQTRTHPVPAMYFYVCGLPPYILGTTQSQQCIFMSVACLLTNNSDPPSPSNIYLCLWPASLQTQTHPVPAMYIYVCGLPPYKLRLTQSQLCIFMSVVCLLTKWNQPAPSISVVITVTSKAKVTFHMAYTLIVDMLQYLCHSKVTSFLPSSTIRIHIFYGHRFIPPATQFHAVIM